MQTNLKTLSRQYANGILTKPEYRKARAELIEATLDNDMTEPQETVPFVPEAEPSSEEEDSDKEDESESEDEASADTRKKTPCQRRNQLLMLVSLVLLGVVITLSI